MISGYRERKRVHAAGRPRYLHHSLVFILLRGFRPAFIYLYYYIINVSGFYLINFGHVTVIPYLYYIFLFLL